MIDNRPIGIFDSGVGGLTVLNSLQNVFSSETFIYVGDNQNAPWGNKDKETLFELTQNIIDFLLKKDIKCLIVACNTTCAYFKHQIQDQLSIPVIDLLDEACHDAISSSLNQRICVMATKVTISQHQHLDLIKSHQPNAEVLEMPCPDLVQYIEDNAIDLPECQESVRNYVMEFTRFNADTLIYACSHYPFLDASVRRYCSPELRTINPAISIRHAVKECLDTLGYSDQELSTVQCYVTGSTEQFKTFLKTHCSLHNVTIKEAKITSLVEQKA